jgi:hypothetical protein
VQGAHAFPARGWQAALNDPQLGPGVALALNDNPEESTTAFQRLPHLTGSAAGSLA